MTLRWGLKGPLMWLLARLLMLGPDVLVMNFSSPIPNRLLIESSSHRGLSGRITSLPSYRSRTQCLGEPVHTTIQDRQWYLQETKWLEYAPPVHGCVSLEVHYLTDEIP